MVQLLLRLAFLLAIAGVGTGWWLTQPKRLSPTVMAGLTGNAARGEQVFWAAGCAACHVAPGQDVPDTPLLSGGQGFATDFGTFYAPNISTDQEHGIGAWSLDDFADAVVKGVSPEGQHYYPAFPYTSYAKMAPQNLMDLWEFMQTLPADATPSKPHEVGFPFNIRRTLGGWKLLFANADWVLEAPDTDALKRGRYLVEALGHCAECHTPRNALGGLQRDSWLTGAPTPDGKGRVPGLTPTQLTWSAEDIQYYLQSGFTPDFDSAGGHMAEVVSNLARLPDSDRAAIVAYLKAVPTR